MSISDADVCFRRETAQSAGEVSRPFFQTSYNVGFNDGLFRSHYPEQMIHLLEKDTTNHV